MIQFIFNKKGETILETIIALGILSVGITLASTVLATSLRNMNASKNRVIAVNIAREGLEAVRNIRDTNWLKFNSYRRQCWNNDPAYNTCVDATNPILSGDYIIYKQALFEDAAEPAKLTGWKWRLEILLNDQINSFDNNHIPEAPPNQYYNTDKKISYIWDEAKTEWVDLTKLSLVDLDPETDTDGDGVKNNDSDAYNHVLVNDNGENNALGKDFAKNTAFNRVLSIAYLTDDGELKNDNNLPPDAVWNRMRIVSRVEWQEGKNRFHTELVSQLTDYLGREKMDSL